MRIVNKNNVDEVVDIVLSRAKYQKVLLCIDETSNFDFVQHIENSLGRKAVLLKYYFNNDMKNFFAQLNDGVRVVIYNVDIEHFALMQNDNNYLFNVFVPTGNFVLPYMLNCESVYGDNLLVCNDKKDYLSVMLMYEAGLECVWANIQQNERVDLTQFKLIDNLINNDEEFYVALLESVNNLRQYISTDFFAVSQDELPYYIYLKMGYILKMFEKLNLGEEQYIDFYKTTTNVEEILKAYDVVVKYEFVELIKFYSNNLMRVSGAILNRLKIIIKRFFKIKNIKLNKIKNIIKNQAKLLKTDNLLYISYIFDVI